MNNVYDLRRNTAKDILDRILDEYHCAGFSEFIGTTGGDARTIRIYGRTEEEFTIYER